MLISWPNVWDVESKIVRRLKMNNPYDRYIYLHINQDEKGKPGITVHVNIGDDGIVVDAWSGEDECIASTWKTYGELGIEVKAIEDDTQVGT